MDHKPSGLYLSISPERPVTPRISISTGRLVTPKVVPLPKGRHPYKKGTELTFPDGIKYVVSDRGPWIRVTARRHEGKMNGIHNNSVRRRSSKPSRS